MTSAWELAIKIGIGKLDFAGQMNIITADENIARYGVSKVW
jgi:PIN domain nuclease of toxin-antitoxin system